MAYTTIKKPSDYFNTKLYTGDGSNPRTLTGVGFQPDWVWLKNRTDANGHTLADSVRGANKTLSSDGTGAEVTDKSDGHLDAFTSDGFTVGAGTDDARVNNSGSNYVAWNWLASNTTAANTDGSISSTVSASATSGFSIVSYTGTGSVATVGHGLGAVPKMFIIKRINSTGGWITYHSGYSAGATAYLNFNANTQFTDSGMFNNTPPTSSVFTIGTGTSTNESGGTYIAYCFADVQGYSKFGSYIGNGNADGTFVYTGFKPAFVIIRLTSGNDNWIIQDDKRNTFNSSTSERLRVNSSGAEFSSSNPIDLYSNGFKSMSGTDGEFNGSGSSYIYMAFAEQPLVGDNPATAR